MHILVDRVRHTFYTWAGDAGGAVYNNVCDDEVSCSGYTVGVAPMTTNTNNDIVS